jgi:hypothetical protein
MFADPELSAGLIATEFTARVPSVEDGFPLSDSRAYVARAVALDDMRKPVQRSVILQVLRIEAADDWDNFRTLIVSDGVHQIKAEVHDDLWEHLEKKADTKLSALCVIEIAGRKNDDWGTGWHAHPARGLIIGLETAVKIIRRATTQIGDPEIHNLPSTEIDERRLVKSLSDLLIWSWADRRSAFGHGDGLRGVAERRLLKVPCLQFARRMVSFSSRRDANGLLTASRAHAHTLGLLFGASAYENHRLRRLCEVTAACARTDMITERMVQWLMAHANDHQTAVLRDPAVRCHFSDILRQAKPDKSIFEWNPRSSQRGWPSFLHNEKPAITTTRHVGRFQDNPSSLRLLFRGSLQQQAYRQLMALRQHTSEIQITNRWSSELENRSTGYHADLLGWLPHSTKHERYAKTELHELQREERLHTVRRLRVPEHCFELEPITLRDIAHAALKEYACCSSIESILKLSQCALVLDGACVALPITHAVTWLLLGLSENAWQDSFSSRSTPVPSLAYAASSQLANLIPIVALPWPDILSNISPYFLDSDVARAQRYKPVSRAFSEAVDRYLLDSKRTEFVQRRSPRLTETRGTAKGSGKAFVKSCCALAMNSTIMALDGLSFSDASSAFSCAFSDTDLRALLEFRCSCDPGLTDGSLASLFQSAPYLQKFWSVTPPSPPLPPPALSALIHYLKTV